MNIQNECEKYIKEEYGGINGYDFEKRKEGIRDFAQHLSDLEKQEKGYCGDGNSNNLCSYHKKKEERCTKCHAPFARHHSKHTTEKGIFHTSCYYSPPQKKEEEEKKIEVCDKCFKASCWYGEFMCDESQTAGTVIRTVKELRKLGLEHENFWSDEKFLEIYGTKKPNFTQPQKKEECCDDCSREQDRDYWPDEDTPIFDCINPDCKCHKKKEGCCEKCWGDRVKCCVHHNCPCKEYCGYCKQKFYGGTSGAFYPDYLCGNTGCTCYKKFTPCHTKEGDKIKLLDWSKGQTTTTDVYDKINEIINSHNRK